MSIVEQLNDSDIQTHIDNIEENGFTIISKAFSDNLADMIINDFEKWTYNNKCDFKRNTFNRVTGFHMYNNNTLNLVTNPIVDTILGKIFKKPQSIYSSLFFREGTAQHFHRDTPHFYTNPINQYYGVWFALEDIHPNAGPLKYYIKSHKIETIYGYDTCNELFPNKQLTNEALTIEENLQCLLHYNKIIEDKCEKFKLIKTDESNYLNKIYKGDIIIWHPNLLHGGSEILDNTLTRYSMVTHNVPKDIPVFNANHFFTQSPTQEYCENTCKFSYIYHNNIPIVNHNSNPQVQKTYI